MAANFAQWGNDLYTGKRSYNVVGARRKFFAVSAGIILICVLILIFRGFNLGIEFRGGSEFRVTTSEQDTTIAEEAFNSVVPGRDAQVVTIGTNAVRIQTTELTEDQVGAVREALAEAYGVEAGQDVTSSSIGASWGSDVSNKTIRGAVIFLLLVTLAMTLYFRAWRMAVSALAALLHDLIVTVTVYAIVGWELSPATLIGFLTVLGYSLYDTVVIFDKVRENTANVLDQSQYTYAEAANLAVNQTMVRSINTSVVALLPVGSILFIGAFLLGAGTLQDISLALFVGMAAGTYSSVFLATPMEVALRQYESKLKAHTAKVLTARAAAGGVAPGAVSRLTPIGALRPGAHQGQAAQPRRKRPVR
ncbi:MAG: protein translocase subunit SecF [Bifidobacteriaceae bacterium]|jgi:preprotein translocase subunit SecF|nr:protein translocase subunit SecF [Bifidobacteriaceae bacterium]